MLGRTTIDHIDFAVDGRIPGGTVVPFRENLSSCRSNDHRPEWILWHLLGHSNGQAHVLIGAHVLLRTLIECSTISRSIGD